MDMHVETVGQVGGHAHGSGDALARFARREPWRAARRLGLAAAVASQAATGVLVAMLLTVVTGLPQGFPA